MARNYSYDPSGNYGTLPKPAQDFNQGPLLPRQVLSRAGQVLIRPSIGDFTLAQHNHQNVVGGGRLSPLAILNPYYFRAHMAVDQSIPNNAWTTMVLGTEDFDPNNNFASNSYTVPVTGLYHFDLSCLTNTTAGFIQGIGLRYLVNGAVVLSAIVDFDNGVSYDYMGRSLTDTVQLTTGDSVVSQVIIIWTGGPVNLLGDVNNKFAGFLVSPST